MVDLVASGTLIAHYRVVSPLGQGGMGAVYLADDTRLGRRLALKILPPEFAADPALETNNGRVAQRARILPRIRTLFAARSRDELLERLAAIGVPGAKIGRPEDLFEDEHLNAGGGLVDITLPDGRTTRLPALPVEMDGGRFGKRRDLKAPGEDSREVLQELGLGRDEIDAFVRAGAVG